MTPPLTNAQKADAWDDAANFLGEKLREGLRMSGDREEEHIDTVIVPFLRAMAKRVRGRAPKRQRAKSPPR
jgi:hypothetical protein